MSDATTLVYTCLDEGCELDIEAPDEDTLVEVVGRHMRDVHNTFELDEVIIVNSTTREG